MHSSNRAAALRRRAVAALAAALVAGCSVAGVRGAPQPPYEVVAALGDEIQIRRYAPRVAAEVRLPSETEDRRDRAFRVLFDYISGANADARSIAMTAPVAVEEGRKIAMTAPAAERARPDA